MSEVLGATVRWAADTSVLPELYAGTPTQTPALDLGAVDWEGPPDADISSVFRPQGWSVGDADDGVRRLVRTPGPWAQVYVTDRLLGRRAGRDALRLALRDADQRGLEGYLDADVWSQPVPRTGCVPWGRRWLLRIRSAPLKVYEPPRIRSSSVTRRRL